MASLLPVLRTKLVKFVMNFVEDENFVVIGTVALDDVVDDVDFENVDDLDAIEEDHDTAGSAAGNVFHFVRLKRRLHGPVRREEGKHEMITWLKKGRTAANEIGHTKRGEATEETEENGESNTEKKQKEGNRGSRVRSKRRKKEEKRRRRKRR